MTSRLLFALAILCALAADASAGIELEVHGTPAGTDDYLCWSPTLARIRLVGEAANRNVTLQSSQRATGGDQGEVWFQAVGAAAPNWTTFTPVDSLPLTLPATGAWKEFWIAGKQSSGGSKLPDGTAVTDGKDTLVLVKDAA
ncbi:MAG: hypothetical protein JNG89_05585, partial [Planctomycetaceae bacterium]|nr:hypothetical protein [Planctomycetaceae bacterium]